MDATLVVRLDFVQRVHFLATIAGVFRVAHAIPITRAAMHVNQEAGRPDRFYGFCFSRGP
jgi:hypothetical protein